MYDPGMILKAAGTMIFAADRGGTVQIFNSAAERMLGWSADEVVGRRTLEQWCDPAEVADRAAELSRKLGRTIPPGFEVFITQARDQINERQRWTFVRKDGTRIPVQLTVSAIRDALGTITGFVGTADELTATVETEGQHGSFFDISIDLLGIANTDGYFKRINPAFGRVLGWTEEEFLATPFLDFVHPEDQPATRELVTQLAAGESTPHFENRYLCKNGTWRHLAWTCTPQPDGSLYAVGRDVTTLKQAEESLRQTQQDLAITLNSIGDAVLATDAERRITRMNPVAEQLTGWKQSEAIGLSIEQVVHIVHEDTRLPAVIPDDEVLARGTIHGLANHTVLISRDGTERPVAESAALIRNDAGHITGVVLVLRDTSKDRALERELQASNAHLEKQVAARTADLLKEQHRLRYSNLVLESIASDAPLDETLQLITNFVADGDTITPCGIVLFDAKKERLQLCVDRDLPKDLAESLLQLPSDDPDHWLWQAVYSGQRTVIEHSFGTVLGKNIDRHFIWVEPLVSRDGKRLGGIVTLKEHGGPPGEVELALVESACRLARLAIQRVQNRESLEASEKRHRTLLEHFPAPVFVYDRKSLQYLVVSDRAVDEYGYSRDEFMQMTIADIRPKEDLQALRKMLNESGTTFVHQGLWRHLKKNGSLIDVQITTYGLELDGRAACIVLAQDVSEQLQAENALRRSRALKLAILQSSLDAIVTMNSQGRIVEFNRAAEDTFGYTKAEVLGQLVSDLLIPDELRESHERGIARYLSTGESRIICKRIQTNAMRRNRQTFPAELTVVPVVVDGEQLFTAFLRDLTETRKAEREFHRTSELLQAIANETTDAIFVKDAQGKYLLFNRAAAELTGRRVDEVLGRDDIFVFGENHGRLVMRNDQQVMQSNKTEIIEEELAAAGVTRNYHVLKTPLRDTSGKVVGIIGISRDITERRRMESTLRASEERYRSIVEQSPDMIFVNRDDRISFINQAGVDLLGASSAEELQGSSPFDHFHPDDHSQIRQRLVMLRLGPGTVPIVEEHLIARGGRVIDVDVQASSYFSDGKLEIQVVCRDVTARKRAEHEQSRRVRYSNFNADVGMGLSQMPTLPEMLQRCAEAMVTHLNAAFARVWLLNERHGWLELQASAGVCQRLDELQARVAVGQQTIGRIAAEKLPFVTGSIVNNIDVGDAQWAGSNQLVSFAGYPLLVEGRCLGVVALFSRDSFDEELLDHLAMAANGMAQNIERKNAASMLAELNTTLEQRVIQRTLELKASEQFNQTTLDTLSAHVAVVDRNGDIVATNAAWRKFAVENGTGFRSVSEGANYIAVCDSAAEQGDADAALVAQALRNVLSGECSAWSHEYPCHTPTKLSWYICQVTLGYINQQPHAVIAHEDITSVKIAQEELREAKEKAIQASKSKSEFLATMSHELRTPLNGILGMNQLLLTTELSERQREYVAACNTSGQLLLQLINDSLDLSKIEAGKLELDPRECDVDAFTYDVVDMMSHSARTKHLQLNCRVTPDARILGLFDDSRLRQVLVNLLSNAIKFTSSGSIFVLVERIAEKERTVRLRFSVSDTGIGIPQERLDRLFKSFSQVDSSTTRQYGGTGLGLSICKQLIELMGGDIGVESQVGVGTTFWFEIEIATPNVTSIAKQEMRLLGGTQVIAIQGRDRVYVEVAECMRSWNCPFRQVASVDEAIASVQSSLTTDRPVRIVLADCQLASDVRLEKLNELTTLPQIHLIGLGAPPGEDARSHLVGLGFRHVLNDPLRPSVLFNALVEALALRKEGTAEKADRPTVSTLARVKVCCHILVAEDNPINQLYIRELLKHFGCTSDLVANGEEALAAVQQQHYDLVLMDCQMPEMDGFTTSREIRRKEASGEIPQRNTIVALTANALEGDRQRCLEAGMDDYLAKPLRPEKLHEVLQKYSNADNSESLEF